MLGKANLFIDKVIKITNLIALIFIII